MDNLTKVSLTMVNIINCIINNYASIPMACRLKYLAYEYPNLG
jgi:hypothetical protein